MTAIMCSHILDIEQDYIRSGNHLRSLPGIVAFYPGEYEVECGRQAMFNNDVWKKQRLRHNLQQSYDVKCIK